MVCSSALRPGQNAYGPKRPQATNTASASGTLVEINPGRESGFEVAEQLHQAGGPSPSPVILISTHAAQDFTELIETSPAVGFLSKSALTCGAIHDLVGGSARLEEGDHR